MSSAGAYLKTAKSIFASFEEGKPHSSITDWIEVLSSDRYDELSLDGIPELVESVNILGMTGTTEAARAIRKKLKYGNVHRQLRALVILRALTENAGKGFQLNWADGPLMQRLKEMAADNLLDPKVKKRMILVFHAWSIQYKDEPRMQTVAGLYRQYGGAGPGVRKASTVPTTGGGGYSTTSAASKGAGSGGFTDHDTLFSHDWKPSQRGADTYADLASAKADADERRLQRERRVALEQREAELERREREQRRKQDMSALEARRQKEAAEEAERRRKAKEEQRNEPALAAAQAKKPKFDFQKEKPQIMVAIANALQAANNLVNSCRHINREFESVTESPKVQEALDNAKNARRAIIRYVQLVTEESFVGTLLDANEKVVEAIQLYDKLSKPAVLDSDSDDEPAPSKAGKTSDMEALNRKMEAQKLEADRTGELQRLQERQKRESARQQQRRAAQKPQRQASAHPDLDDLDFGSISSGKASSRLPAPIHPDSDSDAYGGETLSDFSDYDSSDDDYRRSKSRRQSTAQAPAAAAKRGSVSYRTLEEEGGHGRKGLLDPNDPFGDPFADVDELETPIQERPRMQWTEI